MQNNQTMLEVLDQNGQKQSVEVVFTYQDEMTKKEYIVYTKNEKAQNDMVILYASLVAINGDTMVFEDISDDEWKMLKEKMRDAIHT